MSTTTGNSHAITLLTNNRQLTNSYAFGISATFKSTGAPVLMVNPLTGLTSVTGVAVEQSTDYEAPLTSPITSTKNFATWTTEITNCWTTVAPVGFWSMNEPGCMNQFAIDYLFATGYLLIAPKNLIKSNNTQLIIGSDFSLLTPVLSNPAIYLNVTAVYATNGVASSNAMLSKAEKNTNHHTKALALMVIVATLLL